MAVERAAGATSLIDILDRILDKGIVLDAWVRLSLVGIDLIAVETRVIVASMETCLEYSDPVGQQWTESRGMAKLTATGMFGNAGSSRSALRTDDDDEDDDDGETPQGSGSYGSPALINKPSAPRRRPLSRRTRTRRR